MPTMTAVEKAELARLRCAAPTTIPAFAEARARRLAELEARYLAETADTPSPSPTPEPQRDKWEHALVILRARPT